MNIKRLIQSFKDAVRGLLYVLKHEQNFRIQVVVGIVVLLVAWYVKVTKSEYIVLFMMIIFVLLLEILNSVLEKFIDLLKPRLHDQVAVVKDILAAMVLCASIGAALIGIIIFLPYII